MSRSSMRGPQPGAGHPVAAGQRGPAARAAPAGQVAAVAQLPVRGGDGGPADRQRLGQLALGGQPDAQRQPAVGEQAADRAGQRGVVRAAPRGPAARATGRAGGPVGRRGPMARHGHLPANWLFRRTRIGLQSGMHGSRIGNLRATALRSAAGWSSSTPAWSLYGVSMALMVESGLGLDPWDVFHQGLAERTGLSLRHRHRSSSAPPCCCSGSRCASGPASARSATWW